jgi:hypothetical protein
MRYFYSSLFFIVLSYGFLQSAEPIVNRQEIDIQYSLRFLLNDLIFICSAYVIRNLLNCSDNFLLGNLCHFIIQTFIPSNEEIIRLIVIQVIFESCLPSIREIDYSLYADYVLNNLEVE